MKTKNMDYKTVVLQSETDNLIQAIDVLAIKITSQLITGINISIYEEYFSCELKIII